MVPYACNFQARAFVELLVVYFRPVTSAVAGHELPVESRCGVLVHLCHISNIGGLLCGQTAPWFGTTQSLTSIFE